MFVRWRCIRPPSPKLCSSKIAFQPFSAPEFVRLCRMLEEYPELDNAFQRYAEGQDSMPDTGLSRFLCQQQVYSAEARQEMMQGVPCRCVVCPTESPAQGFDERSGWIYRKGASPPTPIPSFNDVGLGGPDHPPPPW